MGDHPLGKPRRDYGVEPSAFRESFSPPVSRGGDVLIQESATWEVAWSCNSPHPLTVPQEVGVDFTGWIPRALDRKNGGGRDSTNPPPPFFLVPGLAASNPAAEAVFPGDDFKQ